MSRGEIDPHPSKHAAIELADSKAGDHRMKRKATPRICANVACARTFWDHRANTKYCSRECSQQEWLRRTSRLPSSKRRVKESRRRRDLFVETHVIGSHTRIEWLALLKSTGYRCHYCKRDLIGFTATRDHYVPLYRGGTDYITNIVPCCRKCNSRKGQLTGDEFISVRRKRFGENEDSLIQPSTTFRSKSISEEI